MDADPSTVSADVVFDALAHSRRRQVLAVTAGGAGPVALETLADVIAGTETEQDAPGCPRGSASEVRTSLRHVHLPKLSAAGLLDVDDEARTVVRADLPPPVERLISTVVGHTREVVAE